MSGANKSVTKSKTPISLVELKSDDKQVRCYFKSTETGMICAIPKYSVELAGDRHKVKADITKLARRQVMKKYGNVGETVTTDECVLVYYHDNADSSGSGGSSSGGTCVIYNISYDHHNPMYGSVFYCSSLERLSLDDYCIIL